MENVERPEGGGREGGREGGTSTAARTRPINLGVDLGNVVAVVLHESNACFESVVRVGALRCLWGEGERGVVLQKPHHTAWQGVCRVDQSPLLSASPDTRPCVHFMLSLFLPNRLGRWLIVSCPVHKL